MLNCPPVSFDNSTVKLRVHQSVTFLIYGDERLLPMVCFLERLETSPYHWRRFCRCTINRCSHAFAHTQSVFTTGALIPKIYSTCSFVEVTLSSGNFFCFLSFTHAQSTSESKSEYFCLSHIHMSKSGFSKFWYKSFCSSQENLERLRLFIVFRNDKIQNFERLSVFPKRPTDFHDFQE